MANNLKKTRTITDKVSVKGTLSEDGMMITYIDENKDEQEISVAECLGMFAGKYIDFTVSVKTEDELLGGEDSEWEGSVLTV